MRVHSSELLAVKVSPAVSLFKKFDLRHFNFQGLTRQIEPESAVWLAKGMIGLREIEWSLHDDEKWVRYAQNRQQRRFGRSISFPLSHAEFLVAGLSC